MSEVKDCGVCSGSGHVNHRVCPECEGYGMIDDAGARHMSMERLQQGMSKWAAEQGWPYGVPIPSLGPSTNRLVIAKRAPFGNREIPIMSMPEMLGQVVPRELRERDDRKVINAWHNRDGMLIVVIEEVDGKRKAYVGGHPCSERFKMMIETLGSRLGAVTARSEATAMMNLASRLSKNQVDSYVVNGAFIETSKRSGVRYIFRKGLPTIALRDRPDGTLKFLASLCLHPLAFFEDTFAGSMAPSDDVLAHLLLMRSDEHRLWKECNQHPIWAMQSGI